MDVNLVLTPNVKTSFTAGLIPAVINLITDTVSINKRQLSQDISYIPPRHVGSQEIFIWRMCSYSVMKGLKTWADLGFSKEGGVIS